MATRPRRESGAAMYCKLHEKPAERDAGSRLRDAAEIGVALFERDEVVRVGQDRARDRARELPAEARWRAAAVQKVVVVVAEAVLRAIVRRK